MCIMTIRRVGYQTPTGMAGIMSPGKTTLGGIKIPPKLIIYGTVALILVIFIARFMLGNVFS